MHNFTSHSVVCQQTHAIASCYSRPRANSVVKPFLNFKNTHATYTKNQTSLHTFEYRSCFTHQCTLTYQNTHYIHIPHYAPEHALKSSKRTPNSLLSTQTHHLLNTTHSLTTFSQLKIIYKTDRNLQSSENKFQTTLVQDFTLYLYLIILFWNLISTFNF